MGWAGDGERVMVVVRLRLGRAQAMTDHDIEGKNWLEVAGCGNITVHARALPLACPHAYFYHQLADTAPWSPSPFNNIARNFPSTHQIKMVKMVDLALVSSGGGLWSMSCVSARILPSPETFISQPCPARPPPRALQTVSTPQPCSHELSAVHHFSKLTW